MNILEALNAKTLELRKSRDELAGSFQGVLALATASAKERAIKEGDLMSVKLTEADAVTAIQKSIKQVRDTLSLVPTDAKSLRELEVLESLLPKQPSEDEIRGEVESFVASQTERPKGFIGVVMKHLVSVYGAALDKGKASAIINKVLQNA